MFDVMEKSGCENAGLNAGKVFKAGLFILHFVLIPFFMFSQVFPDSTLFKKTVNSINQNSEIIVKSKKPDFRMMKFSAANSAQCISISSITKQSSEKKMLIFWQKDSASGWISKTWLIATKFRFKDINKDQICEIESIDRTKNKYRRDEIYSLISFISGEPVIMYNYHQFEYFKPDYVVKNIAPDSVFSVKHSLLIKDSDHESQPGLIDYIEIKYRKLPCCDQHFEYGIRQKKLVLHLINGIFEEE